MGGTLLVTAVSGEASTALPLRLDFQPPTLTPTSTPLPTPTPEPTATLSAEPVLTKQGPGASVSPAPTLQSPSELPPSPKPSPGPLGLLLALAGIGLVGSVGMVLARSRELAAVEVARLVLLVLVAGLAGYVVYASGWLVPVKGSPYLAAGMTLGFATLALVGWELGGTRRSSGGEPQAPRSSRITGR